MNRKSFSATELREYAEKRVQPSTHDGSKMSKTDIDRLVHELEVHHEELEIQNEELRHTQLQLQESLARYSDLYEFAPVGYLTIDAEGSIASANLTAATLLGRDRSTIVGARLAFYVTPESKVILRNHIDQVISTHANAGCEVELTTRQGMVHAWLDINGVAQDDNSSLSCRVTMTDITKRRRAEIAAAEKDARLRSLASSLPVLICYVDSESRVQFSNPTFAQWLDAPAASFIGRRMKDVLGDLAEEVQDYLVDALAGRRIDFETRLWRSTQDERLVQMMFVPDRMSDGQVGGGHVLGIDITDRTRIDALNARRRRIEERLMRLSSIEKDVYDLLIQGKSNKAIAFTLDIGLRTAERRRQSILEKLNAESFSEVLHQLADIR